MAGSPITEIKTTEPDTINPQILNILIKMENKGKVQQTIETVSKARKLGKKADLNKPEQVERVIAKLTVTDGYKRILCNAYKAFTDYYKIEWVKPKYSTQGEIFKCPTEEKLNLIIAGSRETLALKLRISKDCGLRPIEIVTLKAKSIDTDHKNITPITAKHGAPRAIPISESLNTALKHTSQKTTSSQKKGSLK